ncbi:hypothetical protein BC831DRAFT_447013 [Entophlyctis helioformis]|nr:hypothetical protein BC831DRAFT_447013 [Entophlyctis helioformis]
MTSAFSRLSTKFSFPAEPLFPLAIIALVTLGTAAAIKGVQRWENDGKPRRWNVDRWDRRMMERDSRMTGNVNRQQAEVEAPVQFTRNSAWELEPRLI